MDNTLPPESAPTAGTHASTQDSNEPGATAQLTKVEATAVSVSFLRSRGAEMFLRPDGLPFYDGSYDAALADAVLVADEKERLLANRSHMLGWMVLRTAEIDHHILAAMVPPAAQAADGAPAAAIRQLVLIGAGLDARAWRLPLPLPPSRLEAAAGAASADVEAAGQQQQPEGGVVMFELDSGSVEGLKSRVLGPPARCRRAFSRVDLAEQGQAVGALAAAGHDPHRPSVFVVEGLIGYLTTQAGDALLASLRSVAAPGSVLLLTTPPTPTWRDHLAAEGITLHHTTFEEAEETLARAESAGWQAHLLTAAELEKKYGMPNNRFELIVGRC